jgi:hypothetical protein
MAFSATVPFKPRARLTQDQAVEIFQMKSSAPSAVKIAVLYGVSEKTIRDIWTGRTWSRETCHLDTARTVVLKPVGRPKGRRDQKPRKKRALKFFDLAPAFSTPFPLFGVPDHNLSGNIIVHSADAFQKDEDMLFSLFEQLTPGER